MVMTEQAPLTRPKLVLFVEDEATLATLVSYYLRKNGFVVASASNGLEGLRAAREERPEVIVLDLMLPAIARLEVCRRLRGSDVPILMLTARTEEADRVIGLESGADDYRTKPFGMRELVARLRALIRRGPSQAPHFGASLISVARLEIDQRGPAVRRDGGEVALKPKEFDLLFHLASHAGQVFTRQQLLEQVWGYGFFGGSRTVDVHIRRLREKLEETPAEPRHR